MMSRSGCAVPSVRLCARGPAGAQCAGYYPAALLHQGLFPATRQRSDNQADPVGRAAGYDKNDETATIRLCGISPSAFTAALTCSNGEFKVTADGDTGECHAEPSRRGARCADDDDGDAVRALHPARSAYPSVPAERARNSAHHCARRCSS